MGSSQIDIAQIIQDLGGPTKAAEALGISNPSVVLNWRKRGQIPVSHVGMVSRLTGIPASDLRPDIASAFTSERREQVA